MGVSNPLSPICYSNYELTDFAASALERAKTITALLFPASISTTSPTDAAIESDYSNLTTDLITTAFDSSDPRLVYVPESELVDSIPVVKLAKRCGLVTSNCKSPLFEMIVSSSP